MEINIPSLIQDHFEQFKSLSLLDQSIAQIDIQLGAGPKTWFKWIHNEKKMDFDLDLLSTEKVSREFIFSLVQNKEVDIKICIISILAWGGMNRSHGLNLFSGKQDFISLCERIRNGELSRKEAYAEFSDLRQKNLLKGMGPAYYTKLIFFLMPNKPMGYIMDQWTSRSINLLFEPKIIKTSIDKKLAHTVKDTNTADNYEMFCVCVEKIAEKMKLTPQTIEMMMFSTGRGKGKWRNYLKKF